MHLPFLKPLKETMEVRDVFLGLNHNLRPGPGEFYDMRNLSSDLFPVMSNRQQRSVVKESGNFLGLADRDGLAYVDGPGFYINGRKTDLVLSEEGPKQLVSMGAYVIILPDKKYFNTADFGDFGSIEAEVTTSAPVKIYPCTLEGQEIRPDFLGSVTPENPPDRSWWLDYDRKELKQYSAVTGLWAVLNTPYVKLECPNLGAGFFPYDGVTIKGEEALGDLRGAAVLYGAEKDAVIIPGIIREAMTVTGPVTISRKIPEMDFCIESGNRLWGCRYGPDAEGRIVNELYCSKLGDFRNFSCYMGISTDSYTVSLGSEGPFTGAVSYGGHPLFFKENCLHKVFGSMPSNFSVQTTACRGVQQGCDRSLSVVSEVLYYKSRSGVCAYDGSLPGEISEALGKEPYEQAAAGSIGGKYYISMLGKEGWALFCYDTEKNLWHREDDLQGKLFCRCRESLFCADGKGRLIDLMGRTGEKESEPVAFMAESPIIGISLPGNRYLSRLAIRLFMEPGALLTLKVKYDSCGPYENLGTIRGMNLKSFTVPVVPRRADHLQLKLEGEGNIRVFALTQIIKQGSDSPVFGG